VNNDDLLSHNTGKDDIIDDTLNYFRANVLFRNFDVRGGSDRTLIYLTMFTVFCLVKCEKIEDKNQGTSLPPMSYIRYSREINQDDEHITQVLITQVLMNDFSCVFDTAAIKELKQVAIKQFSIPGESSWVLGGLYAPPANKNEGGT
jgi:hypothetical protein